MKSFGNYAFCGCLSLSKVEFPSSVISLGNGAFLGCTQLIDITTPSTLEEISIDTFLGCSALKATSKYPFVNKCESLIIRLSKLYLKQNYHLFIKQLTSKQEMFV